jgi:hypothetical protein
MFSAHLFAHSYLLYIGIVDATNLGRVIVPKAENNQVTRTPTDITKFRTVYVTYKMSFELDVGFIAPYTFTIRNYR